MRSILSILSVVLIFSVIAVVVADNASCTCYCQVGAGGNNGTTSQVIELGDSDTTSCSTCTSDVCSQNYASQCQGSIYAQCDHTGSPASSLAVSAAVMVFVGLLYIM